MPDGTVTLVVLDVVFPEHEWKSYEAWSEDSAALISWLNTELWSREGVTVTDWTSSRQFVYAFSRPSQAIEGLVHGLDTVRSKLGIANVPLRAAAYTCEVHLNHGSYPSSVVEQALALNDLAYPGQVLLSLPTQELVRGLRSTTLEFEDLGTHRLQIHGRPERIFQLLAPEWPSSFPDLRSLDSAKTNLEAARDAFVGREREMYECAAQLHHSRVLTLTGCGGIGKSRLARELGRFLLHEYEDGVFLIDFGALTYGAFIEETIATDLPFIRRSGADLGKQLREKLDERKMLLILDNCDFIRKDLAKFISTHLSGLSKCEILVTSREALGMKDEHAFAIDPLSIGSEEGANHSEAVRLLIQRVRESMPGMTLSEEQSRIAKRLARTLRGVPLCIELAATKFRVLTPNAIVEQVTSFANGSKPYKSRRDLQQLVDRTLSWIYASLSKTEQKVLARAAVFWGGWEPDAADWVCGGYDLAPPDVRRAMDMLVQKGLVERFSRGPHVQRDIFSQSMREFAHEQLELSGELREIRHRHLEWFLALADDAYTGLEGPEQQRYLEKLDRERHNFRGSIEWSLRGDRDHSAAYRLVLAIPLFWLKRSYLTEARIWLEALPSSPSLEEGDSQARVLNALGAVHNALGDNERAAKCLRQGMKMSSKLLNAHLTALILCNLGVSYRGLGKLPEAESNFKKAADAFRTLNDNARLSSALTNLGAVRSELGKYAEASVAYKEALARSREQGNLWVANMVSFNLAELALRQDAIEKAEPLLNETLTNWHSIKDYSNVALALRAMAKMSHKLDQPERAITLLAADTAIRTRIHQDLPQYEEEQQEALISQLTSKIGNADFDATWSNGARLSPDAAVYYALGSRVGRVNA